MLTQQHFYKQLFFQVNSFHLHRVTFNSKQFIIFRFSLDALKHNETRHLTRLLNCEQKHNKSVCSPPNHALEGQWSFIFRRTSNDFIGSITDTLRIWGDLPDKRASFLQINRRKLVNSILGVKVLFFFW